MKAYLVFGDVYFEQYGSDIRCFGIFTDKEKAEQVKLQKENEFYQQEMKEKEQYRRINSRDDIKFEIKEFDTNEITDFAIECYIE